MNHNQSLRDVGQNVVEPALDHDRPEHSGRRLGIDQRMKVGVVPERAGGLVKRNLVEVMVLLERVDVDKDVVAVAVRADVKTMDVQVRR